MNEQDERMKLLIALQPKFREALDTLDFLKDFSIFDTPDGPISMITPLPIDPRNPERGIEGMIRGFISLVKHHQKWTVTTLVDGKFDAFVDDTPELALLKALAHQEGVTP